MSNGFNVSFIVLTVQPFVFFLFSFFFLLKTKVTNPYCSVCAVRWLDAAVISGISKYIYLGFSSSFTIFNNGFVSFKVR